MSCEQINEKVLENILFGDKNIQKRQFSSNWLN